MRTIIKALLVALIVACVAKGVLQNSTTQITKR